MATVIIERYMYTEEVYYDDSGVELGRARQFDDTFWDQETRDMTPEEREDWELDD